MLVLVTLLAGCGRIGFDDVGVAVDSTGDGAISGDAVTSLRLSTLEVGSGANECLIAALALADPGASGVVVRWDDAPLSEVSPPIASPAGQVFVARLIDPARGPGTLTAEWTGESDAILGAISVSGADQEDCVHALATERGNTETASVTVPSAAGHLTLDVAVTSGAVGVPSQTPAWTASADGFPRLIQETRHATVATSDSCTLPALPTAGHHLVFIGAATSSALQSISGGGVAWQPAAQATTNVNAEIWYGVTDGSSATVSYAGVTTNSIRCWIGELTGLSRTGTLDAAAQASDLVSPAAPGALTTTNARDHLIAAFATFAGSGPPGWGVPADGPWTELAAIDAAGISQIAFSRDVIATGTWNPSITEMSSDPRWDAAAAAFTLASPGLGCALSSAPGTAHNTHAWSLPAPAAWTAIGLDVFP